mgnify:CR=1 FL=1
MFFFTFFCCCKLLITKGLGRGPIPPRAKPLMVKDLATVTARCVSSETLGLVSDAADDKEEETE